MKAKTTVIGIVAGFANGLFGSGGGTLLVPAMRRFMDVDQHKAHATAIAIILPLSVLSAFIYLRGVEIDWQAAIYVSIGGIGGGLLGSRLLKKFSGSALRKTFGAFVVAAAIKMIL